MKMEMKVDAEEEEEEDDRDDECLMEIPIDFEIGVKAVRFYLSLVLFVEDCCRTCGSNETSL